MSEFLRRWWPALPGLVIAWFAGSSFVEKYPRPAEGNRGRAAASRGPDSLIDGFRRKLAATAPAVGDTLSAPAPENPFRPIRAPRPAAEGRPGRGMSLPPPPRNFRLKGTVGNNVATIANSSGQKLIVKVGDAVDSAVVVSIEANKVVLKDRAGRFELLPER